MIGINPLCKRDEGGTDEGETPPHLNMLMSLIIYIM
jgi:hypothetical protein